MELLLGVGLFGKDTCWSKLILGKGCGGSESFQGLGFTPEQIDAAIQRGHEGKLIETAARQIPQPSQAMPPALRATNVGIYHVRGLCCLFTYIDAMIVDTPVLDPDTRSRIRDARNIEDRLKMGEIFRQYLDARWLELKDAGTEFSWERVSQEVKDDIIFIRSRV